MHLSQLKSLINEANIKALTGSPGKSQCGCRPVAAVILFIVNGDTIEVIDVRRRRRTLDVMVVIILSSKRRKYLGDDFEENRKEKRDEEKDLLMF